MGAVVIVCWMGCWWTIVCAGLTTWIGWTIVWGGTDCKWSNFKFWIFVFDIYSTFWGLVVWDVLITVVCGWYKGWFKTGWGRTGGCWFKIGGLAWTGNIG